jgi:hypothetical protein
MTQCSFCSIDMLPKTNSAETEEHLYRKSWLKALRHTGTEMSTWISSVEGKLRERQHPAIRSVAGKICNPCNSGWMNKIDEKVSHKLLLLARSSDTRINFDPEERLDFSKWLLKTACVQSLCDTAERRHIPKYLADNLRLNGEIPDGFAAFFVRSINPQQGLGASLLDMWTMPGAMPADYHPLLARGLQSKRLKFGIRYDNVIFGCIWLDDENPCFSGIEGVHSLLSTKGAQFLSLAPPGETQFPDEIHQNDILSRILIGVNVLPPNPFRDYSQLTFDGQDGSPDILGAGA